jgi:hypothetical protein
MASEPSVALLCSSPTSLCTAPTSIEVENQLKKGLTMFYKANTPKE